MSALYHSLCLLEYHVGNLYVALRRLVESRCHDFRLHAARHISNLFRTLVDKENDHVDFRMVICDCISN